MQIGVNYLLEARDLFEEGKIDFVDYFKLYSLNSDLSGMDWCASQRPFVMFHGVCGGASAIGNKNLFEEMNIEKTKEMIEVSKVPYVSAHICTKNKTQTEEETLEAIRQNVKQMREIFGKDVVLENIPYRRHYDHCTYLLNPETISKIVYENNTGFLFDISHARKAADYLGMTLEEYVEKLPMDRVVEFHLAGMYEVPDLSKEEIRAQYTPRQIEFLESMIRILGRRADCHGVLHEEDYNFIEKAVERYKDTLKYVTLEYGSYNDDTLFEDEAFTYPIADFESSKPKIKEEVLEQLNRLHEIVPKS